jgi:ribose 5-phosphate isomerase A
VLDQTGVVAEPRVDAGVGPVVALADTDRVVILDRRVAVGAGGHGRWFAPERLEAVAGPRRPPTLAVGGFYTRHRDATRMKSNDGAAAAKRRAGESAADQVSDGEVVGLGTGSTAAHAIRALGRAVDGGLDIRGIPTSHQSRALAREAGIPLTTLEDATPDVAIDGADQVAPLGAGDVTGDGFADAEGTILVKGGGAAHAREKVVDAAADRLLVVVDESKLAPVPDHPVPVEVLPDAVPTVETRVRDLGGEPSLRAAERKDGPVVTDNGNLVLDCDFGTIEAAGDLATQLDAIPGVVAHGLFVDLAAELHVGLVDDTVVHEF